MLRQGISRQNFGRVPIRAIRPIVRFHSHHSGPGHTHSHNRKPLEPAKKSWARHLVDFFNPHNTLHSHSHSHSALQEPQDLLQRTDWQNKGVRITWIGLIVNIGMAASKFAGGFYWHSQALLADAVHSVGDLVSDVFTLTTVNFSAKPTEDMYPLGFGKVETLGSMVVSGILLYAGISIGWSSLVDVLTPLLPHNVAHTISTLGHGHSHNENLEIANINAAWVALGSIFVKEWLFQATRKIGENLNSNVLIANAWHHRVDSLTSVVALVTISGGYLLNVMWLDSIGGLLVSLLVVKVGLSGCFQAFKEIIDKAIPQSDERYQQLENSVNTSLMKHDPKLVIKHMVLLPSGTNVNLDLALGACDPEYSRELTMQKLQLLTDALKKDTYAANPNLKKLTVEFSD